MRPDGHTCWRWPTRRSQRSTIASRTPSSPASGSSAIAGDQVFLGRVTYEPGTTVARHSHEHTEQVMLILDGSVTMTIGDETQELGAGRRLRRQPRRRARAALGRRRDVRRGARPRARSTTSRTASATSCSATCRARCTSSGNAGTWLTPAPSGRGVLQPRPASARGDTVTAAIALAATAREDLWTAWSLDPLVLVLAAVSRRVLPQRLEAPPAAASVARAVDAHPAVLRGCRDRRARDRLAARRGRRGVPPVGAHAPARADRRPRRRARAARRARPALDVLPPARPARAARATRLAASGARVPAPARASRSRSGSSSSSPGTSRRCTRQRSSTPPSTGSSISRSSSSARSSGRS